MRRFSFARAAPGLLAAAVLTPLAAGNGGYFPPAWGWSAAALLWAAAIAVLVRQDVETSVAEIVTVSAFGLLTVWMLISAIWSNDTTSAILEAQRTLVYVAATPDVVLMDLRMPRLDGVEATRRIKVDHPATQVVVLTTYADDESIIGALRAGAIGYLTKDAGRDHIRRALEAAVSGQAVLDPHVQARLVEAVARYRRLPAMVARCPTG